MSFSDEEEITRGGLLRSKPLRVVESDPPADDADVRMGQLMGAIGRLQTDVNNLKTLPAEVRALRRDLELDRDALVHGASKRAANHSSNRMAALMGALFTLYELAAPALHELVRWFHK